MGGDKMVRPGGVRTLQDEIDLGLRDKSGREYSKEEIEKNKLAETKAADEENTQAAPQEEQTTDAPPADDGAESSESSPASEQDPKE